MPQSAKTGRPFPLITTSYELSIHCMEKGDADVLPVSSTHKDSVSSHEIRFPLAGFSRLRTTRVIAKDGGAWHDDLCAPHLSNRGWKQTAVHDEGARKGYRDRQSFRNNPRLSRLSSVLSPMLTGKETQSK
jgi:hypothetical protein